MAHERDIVAVGLVLGGFYLLYQLVSGAKKLGQGVADVAQAAAQAAQDANASIIRVGNSVRSTVAGAIAHTYLAATLPPNIKATGNASLDPSGQIIPLYSIPGGITFDELSDSAVFNYMGNQFLMPGTLDAQGNYIAHLVGPSQDNPLTSDAQTIWS